MIRLVKYIYAFFNVVFVEHSLDIVRFDYSNNIITIQQTEKRILGSSTVNTQVYTEKEDDTSILSIKED